jgi:hypothetical protein
MKILKCFLVVLVVVAVIHIGFASHSLATGRPFPGSDQARWVQCIIDRLVAIALAIWFLRRNWVIRTGRR